MQVITCVFEKFIPSENKFKFFKFKFNLKTFKGETIPLKNSYNYSEVVVILEKLSNLWTDMNFNGYYIQIIKNEKELDRVFKNEI